jgi:hypothetical protein
LRLTYFHTEAAAAKETFVAPESLKEKAKRLPKHEKPASSFFRFFPSRQAAFALAASLVLVSLIAFVAWRAQRIPQQTPSDDTLRQGGQKAAAAPQLLSPDDGANITGNTIEFRWSGVAGANTYTVVLSDEKGDIISERQTKQGQLTINTSELNLSVGKRYFWHVRAKFADGLTTETEPRKFVFGGAK